MFFAHGNALQMPVLGWRPVFIRNMLCS